MKIPKFRIGDKVEIIHYGNLMMEHKNSMCSFYHKSMPIVKQHVDFFLYDTQSELVGQQAIVVKALEGQSGYQYELTGVSKAAWYDEDQLKMINPNPNTL